MMQIFDSFIEAGQAMNKGDRKDYYAALIDYLYYGVEPEVKGTALAVVTAIRPQLEESRMRLVKARKGGRPKKNPNAEIEETQTAKTQKPNGSNPENPNAENAETQNAFFENPNAEIEETQTAKTQKAKGKGKGKGNSKEENPNGFSKKAPVFIKPTIDQIAEYATELGYPTFDAGRFYDHYEANGWKAGRVPMKDWHATLRNWIRRDKPKESDLSPELQSLIDMQEGWCGDE